MENIISEIIGYVVIILMVLYTLSSFTIFLKKDEKKQNGVIYKERIYMFSIHFLCYVLLFMYMKELQLVIFYVVEIMLLCFTIGLFRMFYKQISPVLLNHMMLLMIISFIMVARFSMELLLKQIIFMIIGVGISLFIPVIIKKEKNFEKFGWIFAGAGFVLMLSVFIPGLGKTLNGARNWIGIGSITIQPSELAKIAFIFFAATMLSRCKDLRELIKISAVSMVYIVILVIEKDLGAAIIFFITYLFMVYVSTKRLRYLIGGLGAGSAGAVLGYTIFSHVRVRVQVWLDPWSSIDGKGYQITQSLFAIGTGGWFGLGLCRGMANKIPVGYSDFIFSAIAEELGGIFACCIILIYIGIFLMFINISMKMKRRFYKLVAFGCAVMYMFQTLLSVGGCIKFVPSTGVTLPLISYGGSSVISTIIIFSIIQGLYVLNQDEEDGFEKNRKKRRVKKIPKSYEER